MPQRAVRRPGRRKWIWISLLAVVIALALVAQAALRQMLDADFIEARFAEALGAATGGLYRIEIGGLKFSLLENRLTATDVRLYPDSAVILDTTRKNAPQGLYSVSAPSMTMTGTNIWALVKGKLESSSLHLVRPHLHLALDSKRAPPPDSVLGSAESRTAPALDSIIESFHIRLARQLPRMDIDYLRIDSGAFSWERNIGRKVVRDSVGSISVELSDINTDSVSAADVERVLFSDDVRFHVGSYSRLTEDGVYVVTADSASGSTRDGSIAIHSFQMLPILSDSQLKKKWSRRTTRYRVSVAEVRLNAMDLRSVFDESEIVVGSMLLRKPELDVHLDKTLPGPAIKPAARLPHESLQAVSWNVRLDTVRIEKGRMAYTERALDGTRPGGIRFEEFAGELYNISNAPPSPGVKSKRASMNIRTRVNGAGQLVAKLDYDMSARGLNMRYSGSISAMDASSFNEALVDLNGIKVSQGRIDTAWFNINVARDSATGQMQLMYHDLRVSFLSKETGKVSLLDRLKGFVANTVKLKSGNPPSSDKPPMVADIAIRRGREVPLFGFLWISIREGLMTTLGF